MALCCNTWLFVFRERMCLLHTHRNDVISPQTYSDIVDVSGESLLVSIRYYDAIAIP